MLLVEFGIYYMDWKFAAGTLPIEEFTGWIVSGSPSSPGTEGGCPRINLLKSRGPEVDAFTFLAVAELLLLPWSF